MSGTSTCESLTGNAKIPEIARKSGCGGIGIRARLRCVWHYVLASSSLAIRIEYVKQLLTVLAVGSCFIFDGWAETGFLRDTLLRWEDLGKNPVSLIVREYLGCGFIRYL